MYNRFKAIKHYANGVSDKAGSPNCAQDPCWACQKAPQQSTWPPTCSTAKIQEFSRPHSQGPHFRGCPKGEEGCQGTLRICQRGILCRPAQTQVQAWTLCPLIVADFRQSVARDQVLSNALRRTHLLQSRVYPHRTQNRRGTSS